MNVLTSLSKQINLQFDLTSQIINNSILKIKFNYFISKNVEVTNKGFKIYDSYLFSTLSPFLFILSYNYNKQCKSIDNEIINYLQKEGYIFNGVSHIL